MSTLFNLLRITSNTSQSRYISEHKTMTWNCIKERLDYPWDWKTLSRRKDIQPHLIEEYGTLSSPPYSLYNSLDWSSLSRNERIIRWMIQHERELIHQNDMYNDVQLTWGEVLERWVQWSETLKCSWVDEGILRRLFFDDKEEDDDDEERLNKVFDIWEMNNVSFLQYPTISLSFIKEFINYYPHLLKERYSSKMFYFMTTNSSLLRNETTLEQLIEMYPNHVHDFNWTAISVSPRISLEFISKHMYYPWDWKNGVSRHPHLSLSYINRYPLKDWDWTYISQYLPIEMTNVRERPYINYPWDFNTLGTNKTFLHTFFNYLSKSNDSDIMMSYPFDRIIEEESFIQSLTKQQFKVFMEHYLIVLQKIPCQYDEYYNRITFILSSSTHQRWTEEMLRQIETIHQMFKETIPKKSSCRKFYIPFEISRTVWISFPFFYEYIDTFEWDWKGLSKNVHLFREGTKVRELVQRLNSFPWEMESIVMHESIPISFILSNSKHFWTPECRYIIRRKDFTIKNLEKLVQMDKRIYEMDEWWVEISSHPSIHLHDVMEHPDYPWNWKALSRNPNITASFVIQYPEKDWDFKEIMLRVDDIM